MTLYTLELPYTRPPLSLNDRLHWRVKSSRTKEIRNTTAIRAHIDKLPRNCTAAVITLVYRPADKRRRDEDNMFATLKPAIDGLADYGLIPDDSSAYVTSRCVVGPVAKPSRVYLEIEVTP